MQSRENREEGGLRKGKGEEDAKGQLTNHNSQPWSKKEKKHRKKKSKKPRGKMQLKRNGII